MEIAILGTGNVGSTLGRRLRDAGHRVTFGSRSPTAERVQKLVAEIDPSQTPQTFAEAAAASELIILAVAYDHAQQTLAAAGDLTGKILVDCTNPLNATFDGLQLGYSESAAEWIASWATGARVVKGFNTVSVSTMRDPDYTGQRASLFYCGDDVEAKQVVAALIDQLGMEPVDSGPLAHARYLEPMAMLYIHLAVHQGWGGNCALKMLHR